MFAWLRRRRAWRAIPGGDGPSRRAGRRHGFVLTVYAVVVLLGLLWAIASNPP